MYRLYIMHILKYLYMYRSCFSFLCFIHFLSTSPSSLPSLSLSLSLSSLPVHAAVLAINEAIDGGDHLITLSKLQNPAAVLNDIESDNSPRYQSSLETSKKGKKGTANIYTCTYMYMYYKACILNAVYTCNCYLCVIYF